MARRSPIQKLSTQQREQNSYFYNMEAPKSSSDTRNKGWRDQNKGLALLQSMGWSEGQAVGKRQRGRAPEASTVSSEGLRVLKRPDQLGLGAAPAAVIAAASSNQVQHVQEFSDLLQSLAPMTTEKKEKGKKKKSRDKATVKKSKLPHLPTNKRTHTKVRQAKFQTKSAEDYKCIFAMSGSHP
jgi:G-patch domain